MLVSGRSVYPKKNNHKTFLLKEPSFLTLFNGTSVCLVFFLFIRIWIRKKKERVFVCESWYLCSRVAFTSISIVETSLNQHRRMNKFFKEKRDYITLVQLSDFDCGCDASRLDAAIWAGRVLHCECVFTFCNVKWSAGVVLNKTKKQRKTCIQFLDRFTVVWNVIQYASLFWPNFSTQPSGMEQKSRKISEKETHTHFFGCDCNINIHDKVIHFIQFIKRISFNSIVVSTCSVFVCSSKKPQIFGEPRKASFIPK